MTPYADSLDHLLDELKRIDLLLEAHLERWWTETDGSVDEFRGLYVSDAEVDQLLRTTPGGSTESVGAPSAQAAEHLAERIETAARETRRRALLTAEAGTALRLVELAERFDLNHRHVDALLLALAPELDLKYERIYSYLQDDVTKIRPTVDLVLRLLCASTAERPAVRTAFSRTSPLLEHRLVELVGTEETSTLSRFVTVNERILDYLLGVDAVDAAIADIAEVTEPERAVADLFVDEERRTALTRLAERDGDRRDAVPMTYFHGPYGSETDAAAGAVCAASDAPLLTVDGPALVGGEPAVRLRALIREARLRDAAVLVTNVDALPEESDVGLERLLRTLDGFDGTVFLTGAEPMPTKRQVQPNRHRFEAVEFPTPSYERRRELWAGVDSLPEDVDPSDLATKFRFTEGQVRDAVRMGTILANGDGLTRETVYAGCRAQSSERLSSLARKVDPQYTWDDIVLPDDVDAHLREVAAHVEHRDRVYSEWGFESKFSLGDGLVVLFTGPSGTGKTMAAEIVAGDVGLELYRIDLSSVVSKYIGETEKNLGRIFDEAEGSNAILLFDEADALFGERSEVSDAHDRYANVEVDYLLQRIEEHGGSVILTSNLKQNIDEAFLRRIHLNVGFPLPDRASREAIWRNVFPEETPVEDLDFDFLSSFDVTGGNIKNIALTAAFMAADDSSDVRMAHVVRATRREFQKADRLTDPEAFGEYRDLLP